MRLGVALTGSDRDYEILPCVLNAFKRYSLDINSFAVTNNMFTAFLIAYLNDKKKSVPKKTRKLKRWLRLNGINSLHKIDVPLIICNRDINLNCDVFFGNMPKTACFNGAYFNDIRLVKLISMYNKNSAARYKKFLLSSGYISRIELLRALNLLGNDSYIIINIIPYKRVQSISEQYTEDSNRCISLNLYIDKDKPVAEQVDKVFAKNINKLYDFLFFGKKSF